MQGFLDGSYYQDHPMDITKVARMFHVSTSGYYAWAARMRKKQDPNYVDEKEAYENELKENIRQIIRWLGYVPGIRSLHAIFFRKFGKNVSRKHARKLLKSMNLTANRPRKDPYKHMATHDHPYSAPAENLVDRNFYIGPRKVILTDITYLHYGYPRDTFYLCVFRDAYTQENLGWKCSCRMTVADLVRPAYEAMMSAHGSELKNPDVYIHSDQGSQYMSTEFRTLLSDDHFIQSVSGRGNSLDNAPMESFFGRMKTNILGLVALAPDYETASALVNGYIRDCNEKHYKYELGALTPAEFYRYVVTGVYPCDSYYGVDAEKLRTADELIAQRKQAAEKRAEKARQKKESNGKPGKDPESIVLHDIRVLEKQQKKWALASDAAQLQCKKLEELLNKAEQALEFVRNADAELKEALRGASEWKLHPELNYITEMAGMF